MLERCEDGAQGPRLYDWAAMKCGLPTEKGRVRWLLIRRHIQTQEQAYYLCAGPKKVNARDLAIAAGQRWSVEVCFEAAQQETGLDEYEVRSWDGRYRHITLSMFALTFLTVIRAAAKPPKRARSPKEPRTDTAHRAGSASPADADRVAMHERRRANPGVVHLATPTSGHRQEMSLPKAKEGSATVVLDQKLALALTL